MAPAIFRRQNDGTVAQSDDNTSYSPVMANMVTVIIVLMLFGFFVTCSMFILRARRRRLAALRMAEEIERQQFAHRGPMMQKNMSLCAPARPSHHRRTKSLTTPPDSPTFVVGETDSLMDEKRWEAEHGGHGGRQPENVPQIHLTFPEELDEKTGKRESKVVVVTVSEKGSVGLSPFQQGEQPPAYSDRKDMKSLDLDRIGGLKENKN